MSNDDVVFSESLLDAWDEDEAAERECEEAEMYLDPDERLLAIISMQS